MSERAGIAPSGRGRRIALVVDNPRRDLAGLVLVSRELAMRGHTTYLLPMNLRLRELPALAPDHVAVNYLRKTNDEFVGHLMDAGVDVSIVDTEGAVFQEVEALVQKMSRRTAVTSRVNAYCSWGSFMAAFLEENDYFRNDQIAITGPPRMDYYVAPWRKAAEFCSPAASLPERPTVLICGSFPFANPGFRDPEELIQMRIDVTGLDEDHVRAEFAKDKAGLDGFIEMSTELARRRPESQFIYRPHPFERASTYQQHFAGIENLQVISEGPVDGWVLRSSAVVQPADCTTGVEAALAGVPSLIPGWITGDRVPVVESVSTVCADLGALADQLDGILSVGARSSSDDNELVEALFGPMDGKAHERVADAIESAGTTPPRLDHRMLRALHYHPSYSTSRRTRMIQRFRDLTHIPAMWSFTTRSQLAPTGWDSSEKHFGADEVGELLRALDAARPDDRGCVVAAAAPPSDYNFRFSVGRTVRVSLTPENGTPPG